MAFNVYSSTDSNSPILMGTSGSLLSVLDACLVNGYGNKTPAGWSKPIPNDTFRGCYKQPSGSQMTLFVNDAAPSSSTAPAGLTTEAWVTGYASITGLTGSSVGTGYGQFPQLSQLVADSRAPTSGSFVWKKSTTANSSSREWIIFADDRTVYIFIANGDVLTVYSAGGFGDIYSLYNSNVPKCMIWGRSVSAATTTPSTDTTDLIFPPNDISDVTIVICSGLSGNGFPIILNKVGDMGKQLAVQRSTPGGVSTTGVLLGTIPTPNPVDNALYMTPLYLSVAGSGIFIGRLRGMYMLLHPSATFSLGQIFSGTNEFAGKTFQIVRQGPTGGMWVIEISNTLETN